MMLILVHIKIPALKSALLDWENPPTKSPPDPVVLKKVPAEMRRA